MIRPQGLQTGWLIVTVERLSCSEKKPKRQRF